MADENNQESIVSHLSADTDSSAVAIHHTLGPLPFQASPGSHVHDGKDSHRIDYNSLLNLPDIGGGAAEYTSTVKHEVKLGAAIAKGQAVYVSSADGTNMIVSKASNASEATSSKTMGLLESGGSTNAKVNVVTEGLLAGLDTSTATAGDVVWLGTDGNLLYGLANKPVAPAHLVFIGIVTRSNSNNGEIFIKPQNGFEFNELHDVLIVSPAAGEVIQRTSSNLWENKTLAEANIAAADHNHSGVYSPVAHTHDDRYYTETETDTLLSGKSNTGHSHVIADVTGLSTSLADKANVTHAHAISDVTGLQTSLDDKALAEGYTANRVIVSNGAGAISASTTIDTTELGYLNGVTDNIQTQLTAKANKSGYTASRVLISDSTGNVAVSPLISTTELDYLDNLTDNVQSQLNGKSATGHTHIIAEVTGLSSALSDKASLTHTHAISDVTGLQAELDEKALAEGYTANRVIVSNGAGAISASTTIDTTELGYLNGVNDNIQTQLTAKANKSGYTASRVLISDSTGNVAVSSLISTTELDYLDNLTDNVQSQLNGKSATGHTHAISDVTGLSSALAGKASTTHTHAISDVTGLQTALDDKAAVDGYTASRVLVSNSLGAITASTTIDTTELGYLNGVTSGIQAQLDGKDVKELYRFETADNLIMSSVGSATTASVFGTNGVAVEAGTAYLVEGVIYFTAGVVGTSATHIINWGSPSGAATVTRNTWLWDYNSSTTALNLAAAMTGVRRAGTTSFAALNTITMTGTHLFRGQFYGIVEFNAAGNFTPRITVTPTSASVDLTINTGSYIKLQKLGTTNTNGTWS
jgi:Phage tail repeat like